jgi:hypothetical protein
VSGTASRIILLLQDKLKQYKLCISRHYMSVTKNVTGSYFYSIRQDKKNRDSSVGIALGYGLDDRGSRV